jgi:toxin ParE1/3/4
VKPVIFHAEAEAEIRAAIVFYEEKRDGLGLAFQEEVEAAAERIAQSPKVYSPHGESGVRRFLLSRFRHTIFFLELDDVIWIAAVAHQRRKPDYWISRQPES